MICRLSHPILRGLFAACATLSVSSSAHAFPNGAPLWGISGTGTLPSTETVPLKKTEVGLAYENIDAQAGSRIEFYPIGTVSYGLKRGEVGIGVLREDVNTSIFNLNLKNTYQTIHGKYRAYEGSRGGAVAVGAHYLNFGSTPGDVLSLYAVGSKELLKPQARYALTANLGVLYQRIDGLAPDNTLRPFIGGQFSFKNGFSIVGDLTPRDGQSVQIYSIAARYERERYGVQLGFGRFRGSDEKVFVGATYRFGK